MTLLFPPKIAGTADPDLAAALAASAYPMPVLVNADARPDAAAIIARCTAFADNQPGAGALIVTLLPSAPPGLAQFAVHQAVAALWAFTRQAALEWAPRGIRVNAIGLGASPFGPDEADEQAGRGAANVLARPATHADIAATVRAMADFASMTGQIIRLGA